MLEFLSKSASWGFSPSFNLLICFILIHFQFFVLENIERLLTGMWKWKKLPPVLKFGMLWQQMKISTELSHAMDNMRRKTVYLNDWKKLRWSILGWEVNISVCLVYMLASPKKYHWNQTSTLPKSLFNYIVHETCRKFVYYKRNVLYIFIYI